jgi:four helix bundle protein
LESFRNLEVWNLSIDLTTQIYEATTAFPREEVYGLTSQVRHASVSTASNLAEGSARDTYKDFRKFGKMAQGSNSELQTQLIISRRLGFGDQRKCERAEALSQKIGKMLSGLSAYLSDCIRKEAQN